MRRLVAASMSVGNEVVIEMIPTRVAGDRWYVFAYMPAEKLVADPARAESVEVRFTLADGRTVTRRFRPDFADWFAVPAAPAKQWKRPSGAWSIEESRKDESAKARKRESGRDESERS